MQILENNSKACISLQRCDLRVAAFHNSREGFAPESSRPELASKNKCSCSALAALQKIKDWDQKADENYAKTHGGRKSPVKEANKCWEAVVNLNDRHTLKDVKKLVKKLEKITGYRAAQIAIHKDEGHLDEETGNFVLNIHAHVIFYARDVKTGLSLSTANYGRKDLMRQMQDAVADELGMERGRPAEETGKKHLSPRAYKYQKRQEAAIAQNNKEWEQKLEKNNREWEQKKAAWEQKQAEREARREEWERKLPEIMAARERRSKYISEQLDWEDARTGKKLAYEMEMLGISFAGINNPHGNILVEAQKEAIRNIFYMLGTTAQLAVFLMQKTIQNDEKLAADAKIYNVESTLLRAVDYVANSDPANAEELKIRIQRTFRTIPEDKRRELFQYAIENAPTEELRNDIKALVEGRFEDIARTAAAQKRIENRDLRQALKEYGEEVRKIKEDLRAMEEENRILVAAERAILKEKGANREEYAEQEAQNRKRLEEIKGLKDEVKALNNAISEQKQREEKDAKTIAEQAEKIAKLTEQIAEITEANVKKQKQLEAEKEQAEKDKIELKDKIEELEAEKIIPQDIFDEINRVHYGIEPETLHDMAIDERDAALDERDEALKRVKELEEQLKEPIREEPKPEPLKRSDGSEQSEAKPKIEPEPVKPEPEPREEPKDPWQEIEDSMKKWAKTESVVDKSLLGGGLRLKLDEYEKNNSEINGERREMIRKYRVFLTYDPVAEAEEARKRAETLRKMEALNREREQKRKQAEIETEKKAEDAKQKNVRQDTDARQTALKKKRKDELEMGR